MGSNHTLSTLVGLATTQPQAQFIRVIDLGGDGLPIAMAIAGHHAGLANLHQFKERIKLKRERLESAIVGGASEELLATQCTQPVPNWLKANLNSMDSLSARRSISFFTRMLFSALVDADFLDTESFFASADNTDTKANGKLENRGGYPSVASLADALKAHLDHLQESAPSTPINSVRRQIRSSCEQSAGNSPGVFSLTAPTGAGKTLASLAFALEHARTHGMSRVIVAVPFTSIIEQTAAVYRSGLGDDALIEHHSALDPKTETPRNRVASENWDAPIIVTTTVQLLESLFANRPSKCRKLHRLCKSVIVLDEAQTLPPELLETILDGLQTLTDDFGASVVISTATQPSLGDDVVKHGLKNSREIVTDPEAHFKALRRVEVIWPTPMEITPYVDLAEQLAEHESVLAIVHRRADAATLCGLLDEITGQRTVSSVGADVPRPSFGGS